MLKKLKKGFTLVELIIVIAIIAILAVTAFLLLTKWLAESRDTRRLSDLNTIETAMSIYMADGTNTTYPMPTDSQTYSYADGGSTGTLLYQGTIGDDIKSTISLKGDTVDPSDANLKYIYAINPGKSNYALMAYMEGDKYNTTSSIPFSSPDSKVGNRYPRLAGQRIGMLVNGKTKAALSSGVVFTSGSTTGDGLALIDVKDSSSVRYVSGANLIALKGTVEPVYGLVGYYPFIAFDLDKDRSGYSGAPTLGGTPVYGSGCFGSGLSNLATISSLSGVASGSNSTISFWFYGSPSGSGNFMTGYNFWLSGSSTALSYDIGGITGTVSSLNFASNLWTNITLTYSSSDKTAIIYVNGENKKSVAAINGGPSGYSTISINGTTVVMDEFRFYNKLMNSDDVRALYRN